MSSNINTGVNSGQSFDVGAYTDLQFESVTVPNLDENFSTTSTIETSQSTGTGPSPTGVISLSPPANVQLTPSQIAQIQSIFSTGVAPTQDELNQIMQQIANTPDPAPPTEAQERVDYGDAFVNQALANGVTIPEIPQLAAKANVALNVILQNAFSQPPGSALSPEEQLQVFFQVLIPDAGENTPGANPNLTAAVKTLRDQINEKIKDDPDIPGWVTTDSLPGDQGSPKGEFAQSLADKNDSLFYEAMDEATIDGKPLTDEQKGQLEYAHFFPGSATQLPAELQAILETCNSSLQTALGSSSSYQIPTNIHYQTSSYDGAFELNLAMALTSFSPALTTSQMVTISQFASNPDAAPANIRDIVKQVVSEAIAATKAVFPGLPDSWAPSVYPVLDAASISTATKTQIALDMLSEKVSTTQAIVEKTPDSYDKMSTLNFLKLISEALNECMKDIYALANDKSQILALMTKLQNNIATLALNRMNDLRMKQARAEKSAKRHSAMDKFTEYFTVALVCIVGAMTGPVGMALAAAYAYDTIHSSETGKTPMTTQLFNKVGTAVENIVANLMVKSTGLVGNIVGDVIPGSAGDKIQKGIKKAGHEVAGPIGRAAAFVVKAIILVAVFFMNPMAAFSMFMSNSSIVETFVTVFIPPSNTQAVQWATLAVNIAIMIAMVVVTMGSGTAEVAGAAALEAGAAAGSGAATGAAVAGATAAETTAASIATVESTVVTAATAAETTATATMNATRSVTESLSLASRGLSEGRNVTATTTTMTDSTAGTASTTGRVSGNISKVDDITVTASKGIETVGGAQRALLQQMNRMSTFVQKLIQMEAEAVGTMIKNIMRALDIVMCALSVEQGVVQINNAKVDEKVAQITKKLNITKIEMDTTVGLIREVITGMQDDLSKISGTAVSISGSISDMYKGMGSVLTTLARAVGV